MIGIWFILSTLVLDAQMAFKKSGKNVESINRNLYMEKICANIFPKTS